MRRLLAVKQIKESLVANNNVSVSCLTTTSPLPSSIHEASSGFRYYGKSASDENTQLSRDFLAQLWVADNVAKCVPRTKKRRKALQQVWTLNPRSLKDALLKHGKLFSLDALEDKKSYNDDEETLRPTPPPSQSMSGYLKPASPEEAQIAPLLARSNLLITRDIEWANLVLGFEQENRYVVIDVCYPHTPAGFIHEKSNVIARQLLRTRRPFVSYIYDSIGKELFTVRRPFWWITSSIYVDIGGKEVGVVHRRWHLWRRIYDLYLGNKQFAVVENPGLWNWTFTLKDMEEEVLAEIDRDWRGFGFEIFTDAGQYVIRFGSSNPTSKTGLARDIQELEVKRSLTLSERAVAVALAISLDNDYFSRHGGGWFHYMAVGE